jgi:phosphomannomutase
VSDEASSIPDPKFSTITFNIPNPEVIESFRNLLPGADKEEADIILVTDPDADRVGTMSKEADGWQFYTGNEIGILITAYLLSELKSKSLLKTTNSIVKTIVTTNLIEKIALNYGIKITSDLLVGFKYIGEIMEKMQMDGTIDDFLLGIEESNGSIAGDYIREKDGLAPGILLAELASKLKEEGKTIGQYLNEVYLEFGYYMNYLTEIRLPGAEGMSSIAKIQKHLRETEPKNIGEFVVQEYIDKWDGDPFLSPTDKDSRNLLVMKIAHDEKLSQLQVIIRPSGTEPKLKFYFEIGVDSTKVADLEEMKKYAKSVREALEKDMLKYCYKIIGIDFPDRAFLLFWQLPAQVKMQYFVIEKDIEQLKQIADVDARRTKLNDLLKFLGSDPIDKVDKAFIAKNQIGILKYLELE